jgi:hypothetical protein
MKAEKRAEHGRRTFGILAMQWASLALVSLAMACSSSPNPSGAGGEGGEGGGWGQGASGGMGGMGGAGGGTGGGMPAKPEMVLQFTELGELPEGLVVDGTTAYVSFVLLNKVIKIDLNTGTRSDVGQIPGAIIGTTSTLGLAYNGGFVFAAVGSENPVDFKPGIYKFPAAGGNGTLFGEHIEMSYPRAIVPSDPEGMVISAPRSGALYRMTIATGEMEKLFIAPQLTGDALSACAVDAPNPTGISGLVPTPETLYFTSADRATVYSLSQGMYTELAGPDCATLGGADGMIADDIDQSLIVASRKANTITRVKYNGETQLLMKDELLHEPSALAIATVGGERYLYWVNSARTTFNMGGIPGLFRMPIGGTQ